MSDHHTVTPRTMCFVFNGNDVLLMKGNETKDWNGIYDPIGGHIEQGEAVLDNAAREIKEESGLDVTDVQLRGIVHVNNFFGKQVMMFVCSAKSSTREVVGSLEGMPEWVSLNNFDNLKIFEDVKPILKNVLDLEPGKIFLGTSEFDGKDKLLYLDIKIN